MVGLRSVNAENMFVPMPLISMYIKESRSARKHSILSTK